MSEWGYRSMQETKKVRRFSLKPATLARNVRAYLLHGTRNEMVVDGNARVARDELPYFRIRQIEEGVREARVGVVEGTEGVARAKDGDREGAEERLSLSVATMSTAHLKMATNADAMRGMHPEDCGHALTAAIDDLEVGVRAVDEGRLDVAQDRGVARVLDGLEMVELALTDVEATLPCIAYQHSDDAECRSDLARR